MELVDTSPNKRQTNKEPVADSDLLTLNPKKIKSQFTIAFEQKQNRAKTAATSQAKHRRREERRKAMEGE